MREGIGSPGADSNGEGGHAPSSLYWLSEVLVAPGARDACYCSTLLGYRVLFLGLSWDRGRIFSGYCELPESVKCAGCIVKCRIPVGRLRRAVFGSQEYRVCFLSHVCSGL